MKQIYLKLFKDNGKMVSYRSNKSPQRILSRISLTKFKKAYVKVSYGKRLDNTGHKSEFYNDGYYTNPAEAHQVARIFWAEN